MVDRAGDAEGRTSRPAADRDTPLVSVVIPVYNRNNVVGAAVASAIEQHSVFKEVIVVDDGSTSPLTGGALPADERVRIVRHPQNRGPAAARNTGIEVARGEFIAFLDSDDRWKPGKLAQQLDFMRRLSLEICCTGFEVVGTSNQVSPIVTVRPYAEVIGVDELAWGCYVSPGSTLIARRDRLLACGGYDVGFSRYEDWDLLVRLLDVVKGGLGFLNAPLATIFLGSNCQAGQAIAGLDRMIKLHDGKLRRRDRRLSRRFRSGVAFNRAATYAREGRRLRLVRSLTQSILLCPLDNWPVRAILASKIRSIASGPLSAQR